LRFTAQSRRKEMGGRTETAKGRLKESVGALIDNKRLKDKGRVEQATGTAKKTAGRVADKIRQPVNSARNRS
jgi:uncharacterized protein YjbJ (UPF0337 family)